jgi:hypothetical protein
MTQYYITTADSTYANGTANDYFGDWNRSFTTTGETTYVPYVQTYTDPYDFLYIGRQETYYSRVQEEPAHQQIPQNSPEQIKEEAQASERAKILLLEYLDEDNKQQFYNKKRLEVSSKLFDGVKYDIPLSKLGRIRAWKENKVITELCLSVKDTEQLPTEDVVLAKLLHVSYDEENMLRTANHSNIHENLLDDLN